MDALKSGLFSGGMPMGKLSLQFLTVFPPTGLTGLNLAAAGMAIPAMAKAAVFGFGAVLALITKAYYAEFAAQMVTFLMILLPPWYIFDCIQILLDPQFNEKGFQPPIPLEEIQMGGGKEGKWNLTPSTGSLILAALGATGLGIVAKFFPGITAEGSGKTTQTAMIGSTAVLGLVGLAGTMMSSNPITVAKKENDQEGGATTEHTLQSGGGGTPLPPLSSFANQMRGGGAKHIGTQDPTKGTTFLGILGMVIVGGLTLSYLRNLDT